MSPLTHGPSQMTYEPRLYRAEVFDRECDSPRTKWNLGALLEEIVERYPDTPTLAAPRLTVTIRPGGHALSMCWLIDQVRTIDGWETTVERLESEGLVRRVGKRLAPTARGFLVADSLPLRSQV